jgi:hypothetical protein
MQRLPLFFAALFTLTACQPQNSEESELDAFAVAFRVANEAPDIEPMLTLYALNDSTEATVNFLKNALLYEVGMPILSIGFEPLSGSPEETIRYEHQGIQYGPTIEPLQRMRVRYGTEDAFESLYTIGKDAAGNWRIVSSRPIDRRD